MNEVLTGSFAAHRWDLFPSRAMRVVNWNIDRGLKLPEITAFLESQNADLLILQEVDLNARRTHRFSHGSRSRRPEACSLQHALREPGKRRSSPGAVARGPARYRDVRASVINFIGRRSEFRCFVCFSHRHFRLQ